MHEATPSRTALRVALRRAAHQVHDARPLVFDDPLAVRILGPEYSEELKRTPSAEKRPFSAALRAWMVTRARFAEDVLAEAVRKRGAGPVQYLVLGAGLDTFAYRNPYPGVQVFEVDHPATQGWKHALLQGASIAQPDSMRMVAVDFERESLAEKLAEAGFQRERLTVTAWLGVVPYLTLEAFRLTLGLLGTFAAGSSAVFDYSQPREVLPFTEQLMLDSMAARVAQAGEPFRLFFTPSQLEGEVRRAGMRVREDLGGRALNEKYLERRADSLRLRGSGGRLCHAISVGEEI